MAKITMTRFTLGEVLDAMEKNGYPKITDDYRRFDPNSPDTVVGACALGQAAINLSVPPVWLDRGLNIAISGISTVIVEANDNTDKSVPEIAREVREKYHDQLDTPIVIPPF